MARFREIAAVYAAAIIQGVALVTFPAVSAVLTSARFYGLSTTEYGGMFVPQACTAILASLLGTGLARRLGQKRVFLFGLAADLAAMALLFASQFALRDHREAYELLLTATGFLGIGFGFTVPAVNTFTAAFFPARVDAAILTLNALLGLGTALAPVFATVFVGLGIWWGLPVLMSVLTLALLCYCLPLPLAADTPASASGGSNPEARSLFPMPPRFWIYAAFAFVYGICETMSANWASVYLSSDLGASVTLASLALTVFWVSVTGGRVLFAAIESWLPERWTYRLLPILLAIAFAGIAVAPRDHPVTAICFFGLAGLGCSALLPLVISFGQTELRTIPAFVAGGLIGFYQMGYGVAAFGVGPVQTWRKMSWSDVYGWTAVAALGLAVLAFAVTRRAPKTNFA